MLWTVVLNKTLKSPLECKEIQPIHHKGSQSWIFIQRTDVEAEASIFCPPDVKNWLTGKDPEAGKDRSQKKGMIEVKMVQSHLNGHAFEEALGDGEWQGSLACCSPWGHEEWDTSKQLNNTSFIT